MTEMVTEEVEASTQNGLLQRRLFGDRGFAETYKLAEPVTGAFGLDLLGQLGLNSRKDPISFLDLACGTGIVTKHAIGILKEATTLGDQDRFTCADLAPLMLEVLRSRISTESWPVDPKQIEIQQGDMRDTKLPSNTYTHVACNFGPVMAPNPEKVLQESFRVLQTDGVAGWTAWSKLGWMPDMDRALGDIRRSAIQKCENGAASTNDRKLGRLPEIRPIDEIIGQFAGLNIRKLRADGIKEEDLPRWDTKAYFESQLRDAGFVDVQVNVVQKTFHMDYTTAVQMTIPVSGLLKTSWTQAEREELEGMQLDEKLQQWWVARFEESDVREGKIAWGESEALVASGRKPMPV